MSDEDALDRVYAQLKDLEGDGLLGNPPSLETVTIGAIDTLAGKLTWGVTTFSQIFTLKPPPSTGGPSDGSSNTTNPVPPLSVTVGVVISNAVDLQLRFDLAGPVTGTTVSGFPTVQTAPDHIVVDAGRSASKPSGKTNVNPAVTTYRLTIDVPGHTPFAIELLLLRLPAAGVGAFTIPAMPLAIVYAPPQGALKKNFATYSQSHTVTKSCTTSLSYGTSTKTAPAYTPQQLLGNLAGALGSITTLVGGIPTSGVAAPALIDSLKHLLTPVEKSKLTVLGEGVKTLTNALGAATTTLGTVSDTTTTNQNGVSNGDDHTLTRSSNVAAMFPSGGSLDGQLPSGIGDRILYVEDVRCALAIVDAQPAISVLGTGDVKVNAVQDLQTALATLKDGKTPPTGLPTSADGITSLLKADPWLTRISAMHPVHPIASTRFVPAEVAQTGTNHVSGTSTGPDHADVFTVQVDTKNEDKHTTISSEVNVADLKPSWLGVLFDLDDNVETTTTTTLTTSTVTDTISDTSITCSFSMYSEGPDDGYDILTFTDLLFGTYVIADTKSPLVSTTSTSPVVVNSSPVGAHPIAHP